MEHIHLWLNNLGTLNPAWDLENDLAVAKNGAAARQFVISEEYGGSFSARLKSNNGTHFVIDNSFDYTNFKG